MNGKPLRGQGLRLIVPDDVLGGPAVFSNDLTQSRSVLHMDCFHAGDVRAPQKSGVEQFLADPEVFFPHRNDLGT